MTAYKNRSGNSGVSAYEAGAGFIKVQFTDGAVYKYTDASAGAFNIREMHRLAQEGHGLNGFINTNVKHRYLSKEA